jgi:hypothetical protein
MKGLCHVSLHARRFFFSSFNVCFSQLSQFPQKLCCVLLSENRVISSAKTQVLYSYRVNLRPDVLRMGLKTHLFVALTNLGAGGLEYLTAISWQERRFPKAKTTEVSSFHAEISCSDWLSKPPSFCPVALELKLDETPIAEFAESYNYYAVAR